MLVFTILIVCHYFIFVLVYFGCGGILAFSALSYILLIMNAQVLPNLKGTHFMLLGFRLFSCGALLLYGLLH